MDEVMHGLLFVFVYREDILVASTEEEHLLFERLDKHGLVLKPQKCSFGGHRITPQGIMPLESQVRAIEDFPSPTSFRSCMTFWGS